MSAPAAPNDIQTLEGETMSAAQSILHHNKSRPTTVVEKVYGRILMVIQKATQPSVSVSTATIGLLIVMVGQFGAGIWWGASMSKDSARHQEELQAVKAENSTMKVYLDNMREKQIKMEATQENQARELQVLNLLIQNQKGTKQ